ncbi:uncharacterized protein LOC127848572 isoform X3 [Dreissena polymorpha]|uniref:uncharacterized protein LOC127848572 isoform X3 n=1 Tax=Dreissena polymorpha TaxID=45954 RepID=UPI00226422D6|nr:uncharacterized protein LOC127848572 isoform X3 [Dreissena polymorpha]
MTIFIKDLRSFILKEKQNIQRLATKRQPLKSWTQSVIQGQDKKKRLPIMSWKKMMQRWRATKRQPLKTWKLKMIPCRDTKRKKKVIECLEKKTQTFEEVGKQRDTMANNETPTVDTKVPQTVKATMASNETSKVEDKETERVLIASNKMSTDEFLKLVSVQISIASTKMPTFHVSEIKSSSMASTETSNAVVLQTQRSTAASTATTMVKHLDGAQCNVAYCLELAYLSLPDHPDVAKKDRMMAHAARSQHQMTSSLMKRIIIFDDHIIRTMIPIFLRAIDSQIIEYAESMKMESEDTQKRTKMPTFHFSEIKSSTMASTETSIAVVLQTQRSTAASNATTMVKHLDGAQCNVAYCLELGYLSLPDHPDVAKKVRMMAHAARSQHQKTSSLMKKFMIFADHIIKTMIPIILRAIDSQERRIIIRVFCQIIEYAESMKKESEDTQKSYLLLQLEVKTCIRSVTERNNYIEEKIKQLKKELENEEQKDMVAVEKKHLEEQKKKLESLNEERNRKLQVAEEQDHAYAFVKNWINKKIKRLMTGTKSTEDCRIQKELRSVIKRLNELKEKDNKQLQKKKELRNLKAGLCNVESLRHAIIYLKDVDGQLKRIIQLWENTATTLRSWKVNLKEIEIMEYAEQLKKSTMYFEKHCLIFGTIFRNYVKESHYKITELYNFLSCSIYHSSDSERTATPWAPISSVLN